MKKKPKLIQFEKPTLIQFDWSGTISDDTHPVHVSFNRTALDLGLKAIEDKNEWLKLTVRSLEVHFSELLNKSLSSKEVWDMYAKHFEKVSKEGTKPVIYDEVVEVLQDLKSKGKKMIVISSHPTKSLIREAEEYGIAHYFEDIIGGIIDKSESIGNLPKRFGSRRSETIYIGDTIQDIKASKKAGVAIIALTRGYHTKEILLPEKPHYIWDNLHPAKTEL